MFELFPLIVLFLSGICSSFFNLFRIGKYGSFLASAAFIVETFYKPKAIEIKWFEIKSLSFNFTFEFSETSLILCVVTSLLLSCLYLARQINIADKFMDRKFGILNIFVFFMSCAILAGNIFQFYVSIESLGIISAILVSLEKFSEKEASKVFLFNRFASLVFLCAITFIVVQSKAFEINNIKEIFTNANKAKLLIPSCLLLISCCCKSAQMPFSYWLIDAVKANIFASILIHAGTIVAVGIIFIVKFYFIFELFPVLKNVMIAVGLYTAFWMACCALAHNNIKKIFACLTASSAGIMLISCGIGGYSLAILYHICHAFFKSMLFLSFAYLISAMSEEKNLIKFGGLARLAPKITDMILISALFSVGFPFLSGFFAKVSFIETIELTDLSFVSASSLCINLISLMAIIRMILKSLYGKARADEITLSRIPSSENYNSASFWILTSIALLGSFSIWSMYEWGNLHFGYGGIVYVRNTRDYIFESISCIIQIGVALFVIFILNKFSSLNRQTSKTVYALFKKNEVYELCSKLIVRIVTCFMEKANWINQQLFYLINVCSIKAILNLGRRIQSYHTELFGIHIFWIALGVLFALICVFIGVS